MSVTKDSWRGLRDLTPARIALGRTGASLPTQEVLAFSLAHAQARDAVHLPPDAEMMARRLTMRGVPPMIVQSAAPDRPTYLARPDLGRRLSAPDRERLARMEGSTDLLIVVGDGLSAAAIHAHAVPFLKAFFRQSRGAGRQLAVVVARQARVALGDEIGELLGASAVAMLIGERPGLSSPDSLGVYLTYAPRLGRTDAERNCISNIRPAGLSYEEAAFKLDWLLTEAGKLGRTGVALKDQSDPRPVFAPTLVTEAVPAAAFNCTRPSDPLNSHRLNGRGP